MKLFHGYAERMRIMRKEELKSLPASVQEYVTHLRVIKGKSDLTTLEYASDLRTFFRFLKRNRGLSPADIEFEEINISDIDDTFIASITLMDAYEYLIFCKDERSNSDRTRARKVSALKSFFDYMCRKTKRIPSDPMAELEMPKFKKSARPKYLTLEQCHALLNAVEGKNKERDYCIITLFLNCGLRLAELCSLNYGDIRPDGTIDITGKGNKERVVYLNNACLKAIRDYLRVRPVDGVIDKKALFISAQKKRISRESVQKMVEKYLKKAGLGDQGFSVHKLRHTAATLMYQTGEADVLILKEILGHENLNTTEIYTHTDSKQIRTAVNANPLSDIK